MQRKIINYVRADVLLTSLYSDKSAMDTEQQLWTRERTRERERERRKEKENGRTGEKIIYMGMYAIRG
jgi:hypothetical protein